MSAHLTPAQRLAISRALLADALQDPAWLILVQRWLKTPAQTPAKTPTPTTPPQRPPGAQQQR